MSQFCIVQLTYTCTHPEANPGPSWFKYALTLFDCYIRVHSDPQDVTWPLGIGAGSVDLSDMRAHRLWQGHCQACC